MNIYTGKKKHYSSQNSRVFVESDGVKNQLLPLGLADWGYGGDNVGKNLLSRVLLANEFGIPMGIKAEESFKKAILDYQNGEELFLTSDHIQNWYKGYLSFQRVFDEWISRLQAELKMIEAKWNRRKAA